MPSTINARVTNPVHIVALGVRCAVGFSAEAAAAAIRAGISRISEHPTLRDGRGDELPCARDPRIDPAARAPERMILFAGHALREVANKITSAALPAQATVLLALPELRPGFAADQAISVQRTLASLALANLDVRSVELVGEGHAGALLALQMAAQRVSIGREEICIVAGVDTYLDVDTVAWLEAALRVAREGVRNGFAPGEAAAMLVVMNEAACRRRRLGSLALVRGVACARELRNARSAERLMGEGFDRGGDWRDAVPSFSSRAD